MCCRDKTLLPVQGEQPVAAFDRSRGNRTHRVSCPIDAQADCGQEVDLLFAETKRADQRDPRTKLMGRHNEKVNNIAPSIRQGTFDENKNKNDELYNN